MILVVAADDPQRVYVPLVDAGAEAAQPTPANRAGEVLRPEGEGAALGGADRIDPAAVLEKQASAVTIFLDAVSVFPRG